jgi:hypothetical protein
MISFFPHFFSLKMDSKQGLSRLLGKSLTVVAVTVYAFFYSPLLGAQTPQQTLLPACV